MTTNCADLPKIALFDGLIQFHVLFFTSGHVFSRRHHSSISFPRKQVIEIMVTAVFLVGEIRHQLMGKIP